MPHAIAAPFSVLNITTIQSPRREERAGLCDNRRQELQRCGPLSGSEHPTNNWEVVETSTFEYLITSILSQLDHDRSASVAHHSPCPDRDVNCSRKVCPLTQQFRYVADSEKRLTDLPAFDPPSRNSPRSAFFLAAASTMVTCDKDFSHRSLSAIYIPLASRRVGIDIVEWSRY